MSPEALNDTTCGGTAAYPADYRGSQKDTLHSSAPPLDSVVDDRTIMDSVFDDRTISGTAYLLSPVHLVCNGPCVAMQAYDLCVCVCKPDRLADLLLTCY